MVTVQQHMHSTSSLDAKPFAAIASCEASWKGHLPSDDKGPARAWPGVKMREMLVVCLCLCGCDPSLTADKANVKAKAIEAVEMYLERDAQLGEGIHVSKDTIADWVVVGTVKDSSGTSAWVVTLDHNQLSLRGVILGDEVVYLALGETF
jgi:hypothetical protein